MIPMMLSNDSSSLMLVNQQQSSSSSSSSTRTKNVRFAEKPVNVVVENPLWLSEENCHDLWYSLHDLSVMRGQQEGVKDVIDKNKKNKINPAVEQEQESRQSSEEESSSTSSSTSSSSSSNGGSGSSTNKRHYHRKLTIQCIRSAYRKGMSQDKVAEISRRCSAGCVQLAALQAIHDYVAVHHPDCPPEIFVDLPPVSSIEPTFPFSMRKRRRVVEQQEQTTNQDKSPRAGCSSLSL